MTDVGFEPTHPKILVPKTSALDHSANQSLCELFVSNFLKRKKLFVSNFLKKWRTRVSIPVPRRC